MQRLPSQRNNFQPILFVSFLNRFLAKRGGSGEGGEMSFIDHIEELRWHIVRSIIAILVGGIAAFVYIEWIFKNIILGPAHSDFISYRAMCKIGKSMGIDALCLGEMKIDFQSTELSGQFMTAFSSSFMIGFIVAFPYIFWEFWKFLKPALKPTELKYARGIVLWSSLLFFTGVLFAYYVVAPFTINFFASYQLSPDFKNIITIGNYYDTLNDLILGMGIVFELPIVVFFLSRLGIITPKLLRDKRRYAYLIILILAEVITPPDWFSCFIVAVPLVFLYEMGIGISQRALNERMRKQIELDNS